MMYYVTVAELLREITNGDLDLLAQPRLKAIAEYPPGMALVLDGASADLHGVIVDTTRMVKVRLKITFFPNEPPLTQVVNVATDFKPVTVDLGGAFTSTAVSWALPPMHLPPGTEVQVSVMQNAVTNSPDYGVLVTGHLVPAIAAE